MRPLHILAVLALLFAGCAAPDSPAPVPAAAVEAGPGDPPRADPAASPTAFGADQLEQMARELLAIAPPNPAYSYPAEIRMIEPDADGRSPVNAQASVTPQDGKLLPFVEMFRGLVDAAGGDPRILRAVIAHEVAHLSLGHPTRNYGQGDVQHHHTRQEEREADELGARLLEQLGHSREDMVDMLQMLDRYMKQQNVPWLASVAGDHASCMTRAAYLVPDDRLLAAVARFEAGLMFMECRHFAQALEYFDAALELQPDLHEARLNAANAALQDYYDRLPAAVQDAWLRPEFGPHLTDVRALAGRAIEVTAEDLARYQRALDRLAACPESWYGPMRSFLAATAAVLEPRGEAATIDGGIAALDALRSRAEAGDWGFDKLRLALANNQALGLFRRGAGGPAMKLLVTEQGRDMRFVPALAENLARLPAAGLSQDEAKNALMTLAHLVKFSPADSPSARSAVQAIGRIAKQYGFTVTGLESRVPLAFCAVASMTIDGAEIDLFDHFTVLSTALGAHQTAGLVDPKIAHFHFVWWGDREVMALAENDRLVKLTSYRPGSSLTLRPLRRGAGAEQVLRIGMGEAELDALLDSAGGAERLRERAVVLLDHSSFHPDGSERHEPRAWRYFPTLNFGVAVEDGTVVGLTVTPVK
jgi:tetratricopeptide (TPR) repeat protein